MTGTAALIGRQRGEIILIALLDIIQNKRGVLIELQIVDDRDNWSVQLQWRAALADILKLGATTLCKIWGENSKYVCTYQVNLKMLGGYSSAPPTRALVHCTARRKKPVENSTEEMV